MTGTKKIIVIFCAFIAVLLMKSGISYAQGRECYVIKYNKSAPSEFASVYKAMNDTFTFVNACNNRLFEGNVLLNDEIENNGNMEICYIFAPGNGSIALSKNGEFILTVDEGFFGEISFQYRLCNIDSNEIYTVANTIIYVKNDYDCDGVPDDLDIDLDNDGILNIHEGEGDWDNDGVPNLLDIDSDNDGITDIEEWQKEGNYIPVSGIDKNRNGWDDAYDSSEDGEYYEQTDTNGNGVPDVLDDDSDGDGLSDFLEAYDGDFDGIADIIHSFSDVDLDGLDDAFDLVSCWTDSSNVYACNSPLPDLNKNGIRDWRDVEKGIKPGESNPLTGIDDAIYFYPNPAKGQFQVMFTDLLADEEILFQVFNTNGKLISRFFIHPENATIDMSSVGTGIFIVQLSSSSIQYTGRISLIN